jgi:hypothetical protein
MTGKDPLALPCFPGQKALMSQQLITSYTHRAKPYGAGAVFEMYADHLVITQGPMEDTAFFKDITTIRLSYRPKNSTNEGYRMQLYRTTGRTLSVTNLSFKNLVSVDRQDAPYRNFVGALVPAIAKANPAVELVAGLPRLLHITTVLAGGAAALALALVSMSTGISGGIPLAALMAGATVYFGWWTWRYLSKNRPRLFTVDAIPDDVLPPATAE